MRIDIWTDFICPWCYLGKRRLELALERFEGRGAVELHWRSFQLDPEFPLNFEGGVNDLLVGKYGMSRSEAEFHSRARDAARRRGRPGLSLRALPAE